MNRRCLEESEITINKDQFHPVSGGFTQTSLDFAAFSIKTPLYAVFHSYTETKVLYSSAD